MYQEDLVNSRFMKYSKVPGRVLSAEEGSKMELQVENGIDCFVFPMYLSKFVHTPNVK
jgi:hypothetical protein